MQIKFDEKSLSKLYGTMKKAEKTLGISIDDLLIRSAKNVVISAQKATSPSKGKKNIVAKKKKRKLKENFKNRYSNKLKAVAKAGVFYYTNKAKGLKLFRTKKDAKKFAIKKYHGLARAGWFRALDKLGGSSLAYKATEKAKSLGKKYNKVLKNLGKSKSSITIINAVPNIEKHSRYSGIIGMNNASKRTNRELRAEIKKIEKKMQNKLR